MWRDPKFSGDMVREQRLVKNDKKGLICIQQYEEALLVSSFLPGYVYYFPAGAKLMAEQSRWVGSSKERADIQFDAYVKLAFNDFWQVDYAAERHNEYTDGQKNTTGINPAD